MNTQLLSFYILLNIILVNSFACQGATYSYQSHLLSRQTENPDRGLMVTAISENSAFISWRLLLSDKPDQTFELYKQQKDGNYSLIYKAGPKDGCNYTDKDYNATSDYSYWVKAPGSKNDKPEAGSRYTLKAGRAGMNYISIPLQTLPGHVPGDCSAGDLDGDGQYEIIVKQEMRPRTTPMTALPDKPNSRLTAWTESSCGESIWVRTSAKEHIIPNLWFMTWTVTVRPKLPAKQPMAPQTDKVKYWGIQRLTGEAHLRKPPDRQTPTHAFKVKVVAIC